MNNLLTNIDISRLPKHIAIILDGNGRWAKKINLPRVAGHAQGIKTLGEIVTASNDLGIKNLTVFAFSTENINRPALEVDYLMNEFLKFYQNSFMKLIDKNINVRVIGELTNLKEDVILAIDKINSYPINKNNMTFTICFNYGSRQELVHSTKQIAKLVQENKLNIDEIDESTISSTLYTKDLEPLDLVIRTSGECRLSNFLLWQASYAEFYFTDVLFPDFTKEKLYEAILDYQKRDRRFGKIGDK